MKKKWEKIKQKLCVAHTSSLIESQPLTEFWMVKVNGRQQPQRNMQSTNRYRKSSAILRSHISKYNSEWKQLKYKWKILLSTWKGEERKEEREKKTTKCLWYYNVDARLVCVCVFADRQVCTALPATNNIHIRNFNIVEWSLQNF